MEHLLNQNNLHLVLIQFDCFNSKVAHARETIVKLEQVFLASSSRLISTHFLNILSGFFVISNIFTHFTQNLTNFFVNCLWWHKLFL